MLRVAHHAYHWGITARDDGQEVPVVTTLQQLQ